MELAEGVGVELLVGEGGGEELRGSLGWWWRGVVGVRGGCGGGGWVCGGCIGRVVWLLMRWRYGRVVFGVVAWSDCGVHRKTLSLVSFSPLLMTVMADEIIVLDRR